MKPRNTRIKVITKSETITKNDDGMTYKVYIAQHQGILGWWYDFNDYDGISIFTHTNPYTHYTRGSSLHHAQEQIDKYIAAFKKEEIRRKGTDVVDVEYIKYP